MNKTAEKIKNDNLDKCRECGGKAIASTGIMNFHNIRKSGAGEFTTEIVECKKCKDCGHSWK